MRCTPNGMFLRDDHSSKNVFLRSKTPFQKSSLRVFSMSEVWGFLDLRFGGAHKGSGRGYKSISARIGSRQVWPPPFQDPGPSMFITSLDVPDGGMEGKCLRPSKARMKNDPTGLGYCEV